MNFLKRGFLFGLLFFILLSAGCVYFRLFKFKNQLSNYEQYFRIEDENGLTIHFLKPILHSSDIIDLLGNPSSIISRTDSQKKILEYDVRKISCFHEENENRFDFKIQSVFEKNKLIELVILKKFSTPMAKDVLASSLQSLGSAKVQFLDRKIKISAVLHNTNKLSIPCKQDIEAVFGQPFKVTKGRNLIYKYSFLSQHLSGDESGIWIRLHLQDNEKIKTLEWKFTNLQINLDFL